MKELAHKDRSYRGPAIAKRIVYRAVPTRVTEFRSGDWIAMDQIYAMQHADAMADWSGEPWHVIKAEVAESEVEWAGDRDEWFLSEGEKREYFYRPLVTV